MQLGKSWLTPEESKRVELLRGLRLLFEGKHKEYFYVGARTQHVYKALGSNAANVMYLTENLPGRCSLKFADLLFGEELAIEPENATPAVADAIARINLASRIHPLLFDAAATSSWAGSAWWQAIVEGGRVRLTGVAPEHVFPTRDESGRLTGATIKYVVKLGGISYCRVIVHEPGLIRHELWRLKPSGVVDAAADLALIRPGLLPEERTGLDVPAIVELPNYSPGGIGASDYDGEYGTLVDEVNNRRTQISRVLDKHADPAVQALESLFDEHGNLRKGDALAVDDMSKDAMRYITWQAQLTDAAAGLASARDAALGHLDMAPQLLGQGAGGTSADSWKKIKLQASQTLARVNRKQIHLTPAIEQAYQICFLLENAWTPGVSYPVEPVSLTWSDGLPVDETELATQIQTYRAAGVMSRQRALLWIHGDPQIVAEELEAIAAEEQASLPTGFRDLPPDLADETAYRQ